MFCGVDRVKISVWTMFSLFCEEGFNYAQGLR